MPSKKITVVVDASGGKSKELLGSQDGYNELLNRLGVACLVDEDSFNANDFDSLVDGSTYTLGPPQCVSSRINELEQQNQILS